MTALVRRFWTGAAVCTALANAACDGDDAQPDLPRVEVDSMMTINAMIGGEPVVTGRVWKCSGTPPVSVYADRLQVVSDAGVTLAADDISSDSELEGSSVFQVVIPSAELSPADFGLPPAFDVEIEVRCDGIWVRSPPFPMVYLPVQESLAPAYDLGRFWPSDEEGDLLVCDDTVLTLYEAGVEATETLDLGFPCSAADMALDLGGRRYLVGISAGIAAIDPGPTLVWARPMLLQDWWLKADQDPVVVRQAGGSPEIVVLERASGDDRVGPVAPPGEMPFRPERATWPTGAVAMEAGGGVLFLEASRTSSPPSLTYTLHRMAPDLSEVNAIQVQQYAWQIPSGEAVFIYDDDASHLYVSAAPDADGNRWVERIELVAGTASWATDPAGGWRYPLGDAFGGTLVASGQEFAWLDPTDGSETSARFAPDSGNRFLRALVEPDRSVVMLGDPAGGVAQGLYLFAPDGTSTVRFHPGAAILRWVAPGWNNGALISYFTELHWIHSRAGYEALGPPP